MRIDATKAGVTVTTVLLVEALVSRAVTGRFFAFPVAQLGVAALTGVLAGRCSSNIPDRKDQVLTAYDLQRWDELMRPPTQPMSRRLSIGRIPEEEPSALQSDHLRDAPDGVLFHFAVGQKKWTCLIEELRCRAEAGSFSLIGQYDLNGGGYPCRQHMRYFQQACEKHAIVGFEFVDLVDEMWLRSDIESLSFDKAHRTEWRKHLHSFASLSPEQRAQVLIGLLLAPDEAGTDLSVVVELGPWAEAIETIEFGLASFSALDLDWHERKPTRAQCQLLQAASNYILLKMIRRKCSWPALLQEVQERVHNRRFSLNLLHCGKHFTLENLCFFKGWFEKHELSFIDCLDAGDLISLRAKADWQVLPVDTLKGNTASILVEASIPAEGSDRVIACVRAVRDGSEYVPEELKLDEAIQASRLYSHVAEPERHLPFLVQLITHHNWYLEDEGRRDFQNSLVSLDESTLWEAGLERHFGGVKGPALAFWQVVKKVYGPDAELSVESQSQTGNFVPQVAQMLCTHLSGWDLENVFKQRMKRVSPLLHDLRPAVMWEMRRSLGAVFARELHKVRNDETGVKNVSRKLRIAAWNFAPCVPEGLVDHVPDQLLAPLRRSISLKEKESHPLFVLPKEVLAAVVRHLSLRDAFRVSTTSPQGAMVIPQVLAQQFAWPVRELPPVKVADENK